MCEVCNLRTRPMSEAQAEAIAFEVLYRAVAGDARDRFTEVQWYVFRNALARDGIEAAEQLLFDWQMKAQKTAWVTKWVPGDHFYAQDKKFDRYEQAVAHLESLGFKVLGLKEVSP